MTEETQAATTPEAQNNALDTTETPEIVEPGSTDAEGQTADASAEAKPEKTAEQKELERLRRQLTKRDRTQGKLHQELLATREQLERLAQPQEGKTEKAEVDPEKRAEEIVAIKEVNKRANDVAADGHKRFPDFDAALQALRIEGGELFDKKGMPTPLGDAILDSKDAAGLIHYLGTNPDVLDDLEGLRPAAMGRRIAQLEAQLAAPKPKPTSKASDPINPIRGTANATVKSLEQMSQAEYEANRKKQGARWAR